MRILMLVNWKVKTYKKTPEGKQPPDYYVEGQPYWFFRYFQNKPKVDIMDISSFPWLEHFEKDKLRFYVIQALKAIPQIYKYDLIISHGMQSGIVLSLLRRFIRTKAKHIVFDIGAFNSAATSGGALKLMQFASQSIDGVIYHTSAQKDYYEQYFPWVIPKSRFIKFGADASFFKQEPEMDLKMEQSGGYILCVGYAKRDWDTLYCAYKKIETTILKKGGKDVKLRLIGNGDFKSTDSQIECVPFIPVNQLIEQIKGALFCVLPLESFLYSYGQMTLLQQMALGKGIIVAQVPSMIDYAKDGETVLFYEPKNENHLKDKMEQLLTDQPLLRKLGCRAAHSVQNLWNEENMARDIELYISEIHTGKPK